MQPRDTVPQAKRRREGAQLRIAVAFEHCTLCGGERSMLAVLDSSPAVEWDVVAIAPAEGRLARALQERDIPHIPLVLRDANGARLPTDAARFNVLSAARQAEADLLHANSLSMGRLTGAVAAQLNCACVAHLRDIMNLSNAAVADLNGNRRLVAVSHATRDFHIGQRVDAARTEVIYNGVDCEQFRPRPSSGNLKSQLRIPDESFLAATVGQIGLRKGQNVLAEAASRVARKLPRVHFLIVGQRHSVKAESVDFEQSLVRRFAEAGLADRVHWLGYRNDVPWLMNEVDLLVHPAQQEPLGRVLLEAAASGLPIVATHVGGTDEILTDNESARLVAANDPDALADAMTELCRNPKMRARMAAEARQRIVHEFSIDRSARNLTSLWKSLADSQTRTG